MHMQAYFPLGTLRTPAKLAEMHADYMMRGVHGSGGARQSPTSMWIENSVVSGLGSASSILTPGACAHLLHLITLLLAAVALQQLTDLFDPFHAFPHSKHMLSLLHSALMSVESSGLMFQCGILSRDCVLWYSP